MSSLLRLSAFASFVLLTAGVGCSAGAEPQPTGQSEAALDHGSFFECNPTESKPCMDAFVLQAIYTSHLLLTGVRDGDGDVEAGLYVAKWLGYPRGTIRIDTTETADGMRVFVQLMVTDESGDAAGADFSFTMRSHTIVETTTPVHLAG